MQIFQSIQLTQLNWTESDWCCFYYFLRNSLVALLEALFALNNRLPTVTLRLYQRHESQAESLVYHHKSFKYLRAYNWLSWTDLNYDEQNASNYVCKIHWGLSLTLTDSGTNQFKSMEQQSDSILSWMLNKWWWTTGQRQFSKNLEYSSLSMSEWPEYSALDCTKKQPTSKFWRQLPLQRGS